MGNWSYTGVSGLSLRGYQLRMISHVLMRLGISGGDGVCGLNNQQRTARPAERRSAGNEPCFGVWSDLISLSAVRF
jgi:hypothetical protein